MRQVLVSKIHCSERSVVLLHGEKKWILLQWNTETIHLNKFACLMDTTVGHVEIIKYKVVMDFPHEQFPFSGLNETYPCDSFM